MSTLHNFFEASFFVIISTWVFYSVWGVANLPALPVT